MENLEKGKQKAKRKITALDFTGKDAAVALVSKDQGGPANGVDQVLCIKASNFSDEFLTKMQSVKIELSIPDFLEKFFKLEEDDAKFLATLMGYSESTPEYMQYEQEEQQMDYNKWIADNVQSFEIMKSLAETNNQAELLSELDEHQYLTLLQEQEQFEQGLRKQKSNPAASATEFDASTSTVQHEVNKGKGVNPVVKPKAKKETLMANKENEKQADKAEVTKAEFTVVEKHVEMIEKSQFEAILKQMQDMKAQAEQQQVELQKAKEQVEKFEQEKKDLISKQRLADIEAAVNNKEHAAVLHKALKQSEQAEFTEVVKALAAISLQAEQSDLFVEKSAAVQDKPEVDESPVARLIKAKFQTK